MLAERYSLSQLKEILVPVYSPYPPARERAPWDTLPSSLKERYVAEAEGFLGYDWPALTATGFLEFTRTGNRSRFERLSFLRRKALAILTIAECIEYKGRFIDDITNGVWQICEETFWGVPATVYMQSDPSITKPASPPPPLPDVTNPVVDLFAGETAGLLAILRHLLREPLDAVTPMICERIRHELKRRIVDPYLERDDFWWLGFGNRRVNNWNPWCNSNCLIAGLLTEEDADRRARIVAKALRSLERFLAAYHADGGCDEGASYWSRAGGSLFDCLEALYGASDGRIDFYGEPLIQEIGRFLYRAFIADDYFVNFADGNARLQIPAELAYLYGRRIGDERLARLGAFAHRRASQSRETPLLESINRMLRAIFLHEEIASAPSDPPYLRDVWLEGIQVMAAREGEGPSGFYVAAKGGHNAESHNHNDVGHFIVYYSGRPVLVDVGVETYTAKTFGPDRYQIWTMQSGYHNVPKVNGVEQRAGRDHKAAGVVYRADAASAELALELAGAYPGEAGIASWLRTVRLVRGEPGFVEVVDRFRLAAPTRDVATTLMTPLEPDISEPGTIRFSGLPDVRMRYDAHKTNARCEAIPIEDERLQSVWGNRLFRLTIVANAEVSADTWTLRVEGPDTRSTPGDSEKRGPHAGERP